MTCSEKEKWDAELGRVAMRFVDRAGDVHPGIDDADRICQEFYEAMTAVINQMPHVRMMHDTATNPVQLPEPLAKVERGGLKWHMPDSRYSLPVRYLQGTHKLYTEQQVRDILAQYGIN